MAVGQASRAWRAVGMRQWFLPPLDLAQGAATVRNARPAVRPALNDRNTMHSSTLRVLTLCLRQGLRPGLRLGVVLPLVLPLAVAACGGGDKASVKPVANTNLADPGSAPLVDPGKGNKQQEAGATLAVNAYLWRGALDTLSFMPLSSIDPFGGVIVTDWYSPPNTSGERFKATAFILGRELRSDGLHVTVFRQQLENGQWVDAPVSPSTATDIENKALARARELRAQSIYNK
jgi:hypothetical protein